jgi:hypothetical protein
MLKPPAIMVQNKHQKTPSTNIRTGADQEEGIILYSDSKKTPPNHKHQPSSSYSNHTQAAQLLNLNPPPALPMLFQTTGFLSANNGETLINFIKRPKKPKK